MAGIALIALGIACWPGPPLVGMLTYSAAVTLYLAYLGFAGGFTGVFCGRQLRFTQLSLSFSVALGSPLMRDEEQSIIGSGQPPSLASRGASGKRLNSPGWR